MAKLDWEAVVADYRGLLTFPAVTDSYTSTSYSSCTIPLFIKEHPTAVRKQKTTEISSIGWQTYNGWEIDPHAIFQGTAEPLQIQISGWIITPLSTSGFTKFFDPTTDGRSVAAGGTSLGVLYHSYGELILAYIEGRMKRNDKGAFVRVDPTSYTDPYGRQYNNPKIMLFESAFTPIPKKQTFSMTLWLEDWTV